MKKETMIFLGTRVTPKTMNYINILSETFHLPKSYIARRLIEIAIELHKKEIFEFPEGKINPKIILEINKKINEEWEANYELEEGSE